MPHFIDWPVKSRDDFKRIREQYQPDIAGRYPKDYEEKKDFWNNRCTAPVAYGLRAGHVFPPFAHVDRAGRALPGHVR